MSDEDFENFDNFGGGDFQMEAKAFERAGPSGKLEEILSTRSSNLDGRKKELIPLDDRFYINVDAYCRRIKEEDSSIGMSQKDIDTILEKASITPYIRFKNYKAFVLGYLASQGGANLNPARVVPMINNKLLKLVDESDGITIADIIRYSRFWML